jgi:hypothetical protein
MLTLAFISLTSLFYCQNSPIHVKNGWEEENLKGKVKSYTESKYGAEDRFGKIQKKNLYAKYTNKYDDKGNKIEKSLYNRAGSLDSKETYKYDYDDKGNKIKVNIYDAEGDLSLWSVKCTNKYDDKGNLIEQNVYNAVSGILYRVETYKYDDKGYMIEKNIGDKCTNKYDDKGNLIEQNVYNVDGTLDDKYTYKYDDKGNEIERNFYNGNADGVSFVIQRTYKYEFDKNKNWIKKISLDNQSPENIEERKYEYYE